MNENIDLTKILKDCPKGTKLYSTIYGEVEFYSVEKYTPYPITFIDSRGYQCFVTANGKYDKDIDGECTLFPSKGQRDWSKFTAPWYKKGEFDPKTLKPFDKVIIRGTKISEWRCDLFSHIVKCDDDDFFTCICISSGDYKYCVPYNDETKHLTGTIKEAPEYYRYWEE